MSVHTVTFTKCDGCGDDTLANPGLKMVVNEQRWVGQGAYANVNLCSDCIETRNWFFCGRCRKAHRDNCPKEEMER